MALALASLSSMGVEFTRSAPNWREKSIVKEHSMSKTIILPRAWGLSKKDASRIVNALGIQGISFITLSRSGARTWPSHVRLRDQRGARFVRREQSTDMLPA